MYRVFHPNQLLHCKWRQKARESALLLWTNIFDIFIFTLNRYSGWWCRSGTSLDVIYNTFTLKNKTKVQLRWETDTHWEVVIDAQFTFLLWSTWLSLSVYLPWAWVGHNLPCPVCLKNYRLCTWKIKSRENTMRWFRVHITLTEEKAQITHEHQADSKNIEQHPTHTTCNGTTTTLDNRTIWKVQVRSVQLKKAGKE